MKLELDTDNMLAEVADGIGWMTFNRPERRNAVSVEMRAAMGEILTAFQTDPEVRVVVMTGAGDKAFVSGADISQFDRNRNDSKQEETYAQGAQAMNQAFDQLEKPLIAMIRGYCLGGGLGIALQADLRVCSADARFGIPAARLGNAYRADMMSRVLGAVGRANTSEILFTARQFTAEEALRMGLVNRMVEGSALEETVREIAGQIAENAPLTVRASKITIRELMKPEGACDEDAMKAAAAACFDSQDFKEGRAAFAEKRRPTFTGK